MDNELKDHLKERGQEASNQGIGELEQYSNATMPQKDFEIVEVMDDILMCEFDDCNEDGTEIKRDGIWVNIDITKAMWRSAVIILAGKKANPSLKPGTRIAFPNDKGIKTVRVSSDGSKKNIIFINEERIFGILAPKEEE